MLSSFSVGDCLDVYRVYIVIIVYMLKSAESWVRYLVYEECFYLLLSNTKNVSGFVAYRSLRDGVQILIDICHVDWTFVLKWAPLGSWF